MHNLAHEQSLPVWTVVQFCATAAVHTTTFTFVYNIYSVCRCKQHKKILFETSMVCSNRSKYIPSELEFILNYFDHLPSNDSDWDFNGYINKSPSEDEILQQTTATVFQIKPVILHSFLLQCFHLISHS